MQRYSVQFRNTILQKMIGPEKRKAADLSEEFGVSLATIYGWKLKLKDGTFSIMGNESTSHERIPSEKLMLLLESKDISGAEMGEWLRRNGLHSKQNTTANIPAEYLVWKMYLCDIPVAFFSSILQSRATRRNV